MLSSRFERETPLTIPRSADVEPKGIALLHAVDGDHQRTAIISHLGFVDQCLAFMKLVITTDQLYMLAGANKYGKPLRKLSELGKHANMLSGYATLYHPGYSFHPALQLFLEQFRNHKVCMCQVMRDQPETIALFDDFVTQLRKVAKEIDLKRKIKNWESKYKKNYKRLIFVEKTVFERFSRVAVIRLDLEYDKSRPSFKTANDFMLRRGCEAESRFQGYLNGLSIDTPSPFDGMVSFEEVQRDRDRLIANMKGKSTLFEHLITYAWRIECTPLAGYHLHFVLFFDGAHVRQHKHLAQQIGDYWSAEITEGRGRFFNVNRSWKSDHPRCGVGLISWDDAVRRDNLRRKVLAYMAKPEQKVAVMPYRGWNACGTGTLRQKAPSNRGRPRTGTKGASKLGAPGPGESSS